MKGSIYKGALMGVGFCLVAGAVANQQAGSGATSLIKVVQQGIPHEAFFGISFDAGKGVVVGAGGVIYESEDAGATWKAVPQSETQLALLAVDRHGSHAIAVGQMGIVMIEDAPKKWVKVDAGVQNRLFTVSVNSQGLAIAGGEFGTVLKSTDGGHTWSSSSPEWSKYAIADSVGTGEPNVYSSHVSESGEITIAGEFGVMLRSEDGGTTWKVLQPVVPKAPTIFAMSLAAKGEGNSYAVGQTGEILISPDGGATWNRREPTTQANYLGVAAAPGGQVVVTGMRAMMRSPDGGVNWSPVEEGDTTTDWYQAVRVEGTSGHIEAVGHAGKIILIGS